MIQQSAQVFARDAKPLDDIAGLSPPRTFEIDAGRARVAAPLPADLALLARAGVAPSALYAAMADAERTSVTPFDALATSGALPDQTLVEMLARSIGVDVCGVGDVDGPPIGAETFTTAMRTGHLQSFDAAGRSRLLVAARGHAVAQLAETRQRGEFRDNAVALATPRAFAEVVAARAGAALADRAARGPEHVCPTLTVAHGMPRIARRTASCSALALAALIAATLWLDAVGATLFAAASAMFAILNGFRLALIAFPPADLAKPSRVPDAELPVYTVLVALLREGAVVPSLLEALDRLDYPRAKLDIKILVEAHDSETREALARASLRSGIEVLALHPGEPRTKPRALNAGLLAARGSYVTVFDAEDRPEPDQLRVAVATFRAGDPKLACLQARLAIDNLADGFLARQFAIEYAALFDVVLPALSALRLPIPLGGTSNHFRVAALRAAGGWDAGNVTEDADLGLRLARLGWTTRTISSVTWEEAPTTLWAWIRQRTRWMKGFVVTSIVHAGSAGDPALDRAPFSRAISQMLIGGVALVALCYPPMIAYILFATIEGRAFAAAGGLVEAMLAGFHASGLMLGFAGAMITGAIGILRRLPTRLPADLALMPVYWLLVGFAAWRAVFELACARVTAWEKTTHGVSKRRATPGY